MNGEEIILDAGVAAAASTVLVALIQSRSLKKEAAGSVPAPPVVDPLVLLRRQLLEFADEVDAEVEGCFDPKTAQRLRAVTRRVRSGFLE